MVRYTMVVTEQEARLLDTTRQLCHGELFGVELPDERPVLPMELTANERDLIAVFRDGVRYLDTLTIYRSEPVFAEIDSKVNGFRCRKKLKFPTV